LSQIEFIAKIAGLAEDCFDESQVSEIFKMVSASGTGETAEAQLPLKLNFKASHSALPKKILTKLETSQKEVNAAYDKLKELEDKIVEVSKITFVGPIAAAVLELSRKSADEDLTKKKIEHLGNMSQIYQGHSQTLKKKEDFLALMINIAISVQHMGYLKSFVKEQTDDSKDLGHLCLAMIANDPVMIDFFLSRGVDPNVLGKDGFSILEAACIRGAKADAAIRALVKGGAKVDLQGWSTPIHTAFATDVGVETAAFLLDKLDNINLLEGEYGGSLLHKALFGEAFHNKMDKVDLLLARGIDVNLQNKEGWTPMHRLINLGDSTKNGLKLMRKLIDHGAVVNLRDIYSTTPLHLASETRNDTFVTELLKAGADPTLRDCLGQIPLHRSVLYEHPNKKILEALVKAGADVNAQDDMGDTPLHKAVYYQFKESVKWLLDHGAEPLVRNKEGKLPAENTLFYNNQTHQEIMELLGKPPVG
jgi:ankyrin repeat protein